MHPIRVMLSVQSAEQRIAAILHDVVEDTDWTIEQLAAEGFTSEVLDAVVALTKVDGESRLDAARRAVRDPIARHVKLADVTDNMDLSRIDSPTEKDYARIEEYKKVRQILLSASDD